MESGNLLCASMDVRLFLLHPLLFIYFPAIGFPAFRLLRNGIFKPDIIRKIAG
jgi:hypothetical protein